MQDSEFIYFGWPSESNYASAYDCATRCQPDLRTLLSTLQTAELGRPVDIVAHSMGARMALASLSSTRNPILVRNLILGAPDVFDRVFVEQERRLHEEKRVSRLTIYGHEKDAALWLSSALANRGQGSRLGTTPKTWSRPSEFINASFGKKQYRRHSELFLTDAIFEDLVELLSTNTAASHRRLVKGDRENRGCYIVVPFDRRVRPK